MTLLFSIFSLSLCSFSKTMTTVSLEQFQPQSTWSWAYSEYDTQNAKWNKPYLFEKYTVTEVKGSKVTIEMASGSSYPVTSSAHHKFIADVEKCLVANADYKIKKPWTIAFYTKSFGPQWEIVSSNHKPLAFMEKFNCIREIADTVALESTYVQEDGPLAGVAMSKSFDVNYKFELIAE